MAAKMAKIERESADKQSVERFGELSRALEQSVLKVFVGSSAQVRLAVLGLLSGLHVLIEDIPGVGKTTLALALAKAAGLSFSRIQFTPDMLPGDVLGMNVWDPVRHEFVYRQGPIHANFVLADELNRTSPRTQSAFLEAMQEAQVSVDGVVRALPSPFFLVATQNPHQFSGTFPLPEAELDRFGLAFSIGYPSSTEEEEILRRRGSGDPFAACLPVADAKLIGECRGSLELVHIADAVRTYIVAVIRQTRHHPDIRLGASPRAAVYLQLAARAQAASEGRTFVIPEDVEAMAPAVLAHRIVLSSQARLNQSDANNCVRAACAVVPKPTGL